MYISQKEKTIEYNQKEIQKNLSLVEVCKKINWSRIKCLQAACQNCPERKIHENTEVDILN